MLATLLLAVPLAGIWMVVTSNLSLESLFVGAVLGIAIQLLLRTERKTVEVKRLPDQLMALVVYVVTAFGTAMVGALLFLQRLRISPDSAFSVNDWTNENMFLTTMTRIISAAIQNMMDGAVAMVC